MGSANDAAERLLRVSAPPGAIAAPHFPRDHRRPDRVFRPPIGRVDRRIKQEGPDGGEFARQMRGEALHVGHPARPVEPLGQAVNQGMPRLDAMAASIAAADVDVNWRTTRDRQLFLMLVDDTGLHHRPGTVGTMRGERRVVALIHARGTSPTRLGSIRTAWLPPWSLRMRLQRFRKWGRLPEAGSPRLVHWSFQMIDLLAQPIVLSLEAIMLALRLVALALGAFRPLSQVFDLASGPIVQRWVA